MTTTRTRSRFPLPSFALLCALGLVACDASNSPRDAGPGGGRDSAVSLMDAGDRDGGGGTVDAGPGGMDSGMMGTCGPTFPGDCDVLVDIRIAGGSSEDPACTAGQACSFGPDMGGTLSLACRTAGVGTDGDDCTPGGTDCAEGYECRMGENKCRRLCCDDTECAVGTQRCELFNNANVGLCRLRGECSMLLQDCPAGQGCYHVGMGEGGCGVAGTATEGMPCGGAAGQCAAGLGCFGDGMTFNCRAWCNPMMPMCDAGFTCAMFVEEGSTDPVPGIGFCDPM